MVDAAAEAAVKALRGSFSPGEQLVAPSGFSTAIAALSSASLIGNALWLGAVRL